MYPGPGLPPCFTQLRKPEKYATVFKHLAIAAGQSPEAGGAGQELLGSGLSTDL